MAFQLVLMFTLLLAGASAGTVQQLKCTDTGCSQNCAQHSHLENQCGARTGGGSIMWLECNNNGAVYNVFNSADCSGTGKREVMRVGTCIQDRRGQSFINTCSSSADNYGSDHPSMVVNSTSTVRVMKSGTGVTEQLAAKKTKSRDYYPECPGSSGQPYDVGGDSQWCCWKERGCPGRNELGIFNGKTEEECYNLCVDTPGCISVEYYWGYHAGGSEPGRCQLSSSCTHRTPLVAVDHSDFWELQARTGLPCAPYKYESGPANETKTHEAILV